MEIHDLMWQARRAYFNTPLPFRELLQEFVWNGKGTSLATMVEKLQKQDGRGWTADEYQASLDELVALGWLEPAGEDGDYRPTAEGQHLRDEAEHLTNDYFYAPWSCLNEAETADLHDLLTRLRDRLRQITEG